MYFSRQNAKETPWHRSVPGGTQNRYRSHRSSYQPVLHNEVLGITKDFLQPGQNYNKMYGTEPRCNEPRFNEILVITNAIQKRKSKIYFDITNKCQHLTKDECETDHEDKIYVYSSLFLCFYVQPWTEKIASYTNVYYRNCWYGEMLGFGN